MDSWSDCQLLSTAPLLHFSVSLLAPTDDLCGELALTACADSLR